MEDLARWLAERAEQVDAMPEDDSTQVQAKAKAFDEYHATSEYLKNRFELDLWTAAFFWNIPKTDAESMLAPTQQELVQLRNGGELDSHLVERVKELSERLKFFHWELAFPKVFSGENPGYDCVLCNPPWDMLQEDSREFFAEKNPEIAMISKSATRNKSIQDLKHDHPELYNEFEFSQQMSDKKKQFVHLSNRYPYTNVGRLNLAPLFAESAVQLIGQFGGVGLIAPTGLVTDSFNQYFFNFIVDNRLLSCLYDFDNGQGIFPAVDSNFKFSLIVLRGAKSSSQDARFVFSASDTKEIADETRQLILTQEDFSVFNPNTRTCPIFKTRIDMNLTKQIYKRIPVLVNEKSEQNPWGANFQLMFMMNTDSNYFKEANELEKQGFVLDGNQYVLEGERYLPLYEGKMMNQFDHRFAHASSPKRGQKIRGTSIEITPEQHNIPDYLAQPRYWVLETEVEKRIRQKSKWVIGFRDVAGTVTNIRTVVFSILPAVGMGNKVPLLFFENQFSNLHSACFVGNANSLILDYVARQKVSGMSLNFYLVKQFPFIPPSTYTPAGIDFIAPRVLELVYTAYDLRPFAEDMGYHGEPFRWDEVRRAQLRAELDAYYARLYGLTRDELRYILDPKEVYGEDFPGETFRVLKDKEIKQFGDYRTRRLVLEAWDKLVG